MKFCPFCGVGLQNDMVFCPKCGKKYVDAINSSAEAEKVTFEKEEIGAGQNTVSKTMPESASAKVQKKSRKGLVVALILVLTAAAIAVGVFFLSPKEALPFSDDTEAIKKASNSVVMLTCYDKEGSFYATGSAFAAFDEGVFITNYHVICGEVYSIRAQTESGIQFDISSVIAFDESKDLAIIKTEAQTGLEITPIGDSVNMEKGSKVVAIGSPLGLLNSVSTGVFSGTVAEEGIDFIQFTASISHGSSGGALFNNSGEVIGITSASYIDGQNLNLAIPIEIAVDLYNQNINKTPITFKDFYGSQIHIIPIEVILENPYEFDGESVCVEAYISSIYHRNTLNKGKHFEYINFYLVPSYEDVYGHYVCTEEFDYTDKTLDGEDARSEQLGCVEFTLTNSDDIKAKQLDKYRPGDKIVITGTVYVYDYMVLSMHAKGISLTDIESIALA